MGRTIILALLGCLLGVITFLLLCLVTPVKSWGEYAVGLEVALCLIWTAILGVKWP